jgi:cell division septation protein DedD
MPASVEDEKEILLGNKQLLLVFAVVALLLAIAFGAGYKLGKSSVDKKGGEESTQTSASPADASGGPITQKITPDDSQPPAETPAPIEAPKAPVVAAKEEKVLGSRTLVETPRSSAPHSGESYVQVTAVAHKVADATADVLRQHGFSARVAPAPGNTGIFRVLVGPAKDPADLRNTEDKLRKIGYTKCFIQHY